MTKPDPTTMDAVDLYQSLVRALALLEVTSDTARDMAKEWFKTAGADDAERQALDILFTNQEGSF